jgi:hypothetical protein
VTSTPSRRIFISTEDTADERVAQVIELLEAAGYSVTSSPTNPAIGVDPRWQDWYEGGCLAAIDESDVFLVVVTAGYDGSTWMAIEFETAWKANQTNGRPGLFVLHRSSRPLPAGFSRYEEAATLLPFDVNEAIAFLRERVPPDVDDEPRVLRAVGGLVDETSVCLAVYGVDLDPDRVTELLGCPPTSSHRRGERRGTRSPLYKRGGWFLEVQGTAPEGPEELVAKLLGQLPQGEAVWQQLSELYDIQLRFAFYVKGWNQGFDLSAELVERVARLGAKIVLDIYALGEDDGTDGAPASRPSV